MDKSSFFGCKIVFRKKSVFPVFETFLGYRNRYGTKEKVIFGNKENRKISRTDGKKRHSYEIMPPSDEKFRENVLKKAESIRSSAKCKFFIK